MTTYTASEASVQGGDLRELYTFLLATGTYTLTSHDADVTYAAVTYTATPGLSRGNVQMSEVTKQREMVITLPIDHPIVLALLPAPPRVATLTITRIHAGAANDPTERRRIWSGSIAGMQVDGGEGEYARIRVPGAVDVAFSVSLPILRAGRTCQHQLYSVGCTVDRDYLTYATQGHLVAATAVSQTGSTLVVSNMNNASAVAHPDQWARHGEVRRLTDGERRSILSHVGTTLIIDVPFSTLLVGDTLEVWQGCDKLAATCKEKFGNLRNFSNHPFIPIRNPSSPTGGGVAS